MNVDYTVMKKILMLLGDGFEDAEAFYPYYRLIEEGFEVDVAAPKVGRVVGKHGIDMVANLELDDVEPDEYIGLILPGGRGPERLRQHPESVQIVKRFLEDGKVVAAICHGPQLLISAGAVRGRTLTSYAGIKDDIIMSGGNYLDKAVVVDGNIVTSRTPTDLPQFMKETIALLKK